MMRIATLIVDDQDDIRLLMRMLIETANEGLVVLASVEGGRRALDIVDELDPDVVVLDQMMPGMNGLETAAAIRAERPNQAMILCSAFLDDKLRAQAQAAGISLCLSKTELDRLPSALRETMAGTSPS